MFFWGLNTITKRDVLKNNLKPLLFCITRSKYKYLYTSIEININTYIPHSIQTLQYSFVVVWCIYVLFKNVSIFYIF